MILNMKDCIEMTYKGQGKCFICKILCFFKTSVTDVGYQNKPICHCNAVIQYRSQFDLACKFMTRHARTTAASPCACCYALYFLVDAHYL